MWPLPAVSGFAFQHQIGAPDDGAHFVCLWYINCVALTCREPCAQVAVAPGRSLRNPFEDIAASVPGRTPLGAVCPVPPGSSGPSDTPVHLSG